MASSAATSKTHAAAAEPVPLLELYARMTLIRAFESKVGELYRANEIPGFVHTSLGQEAVAAGICAALRDDDYMATSHRGHGHCLAKGADVDGMMAELFAKGSGLCHGKGGSMHVADPARGILGANAIVGATVPLAVGAGLSSKLRGQGRVAVAFFGEGAVNQGAFHEALNLAAIWNLPVVFVCENNVYSEFSDSRLMSRVPSAAERTAAYGVAAVKLDGNDVAVVYEAALAMVAACRQGEGPALIEAETYRWQGHYEGDSQPYKPADEAEAWRKRDPLLVARERLAGQEDELDALDARARERADQAVERALAAPPPDPEEAYAHVFSD